MRRFKNLGFSDEKLYISEVEKAKLKKRKLFKSGEGDIRDVKSQKYRKKWRITELVKKENLGLSEEKTKNSVFSESRRVILKTSYYGRLKNLRFLELKKTNLMIIESYSP